MRIEDFDQGFRIKDEGSGILHRLSRMARGWESKAIEAQQEEAQRGQVRGANPTPDQLARREQRRALELSRRRAMDDLSRASAPAHREMLEKAIAALDARIHELRDEP